MKDKEPIPAEYQQDSKGLFSDSEWGKFRPIDIEDGHLITLNSEALKERALNRARVANIPSLNPKGLIRNFHS